MKIQGWLNWIESLWNRVISKWLTVNLGKIGVYQGWNGGEVEEVPRTTLRVAQVPH